MKHIFKSLIFTFLSVSTFADQKTGVVVIGNNAPALAAGIQSARSGVKTIWLNPEATLSSDILNADTTAYTLAGFWPEIVKKIKANPAMDRAALLKAYTDTVKNLTVIRNAPVRKIERSGKGWEIDLTNGTELKCQVIVDGGDHTRLVEKAPAEIGQRLSSGSVGNDTYSTKLYRTAIATGNSETDLVPLGSLISQTENYVFAPVQNTVGASMLAGQAAGASAAYCAFFQTTTKNINVRMTQGELLRYNGRLFPAADVPVTDPAFISVQHVAATGILKLRNGSFNPEGTVSSEELRLPLKEYYSRSQLWFFQNKRDSLTIEDAVNLIMFTATRGEELRREIRAGWKTSLKLSAEYDPKRAITRKEFAVLVDRFLQPFNVRVDFAGNLLS
ncbi:MAG TPA: hypothetical protein VGE15_06135 [Sphingobacteriaceae bacterium]